MYCCRSTLVVTTMRAMPCHGPCKAEGFGAHYGVKRGFCQNAKILAPFHAALVSCFWQSVAESSHHISRRSYYLKGADELLWGVGSSCPVLAGVLIPSTDEAQSLMQGVRLWNMRFDANCEERIRRSSAA